jgi:hypothetical protein
MIEQKCHSTMFHGSMHATDCACNDELCKRLQGAQCGMQRGVMRLLLFLYSRFHVGFILNQTRTKRLTA